MRLTESDRIYSSVERTDHFRVDEIVKISTKLVGVLGIAKEEFLIHFSTRQGISWSRLVFVD